MRKATYTAAVCKFRGGGGIFWFGLFPGGAQLRSAFPYLSCTMYHALPMTHDGTPIVEVNQAIWLGHLEKD